MWYSISGSYEISLTKVAGSYPLIVSGLATLPFERQYIMKKLNLDETWRLCLSMWRWIAKEVENGTDASIDGMKKRWLAGHKMELGKDSERCFFCEYFKKRKKDGEYCFKHCPGRKIDKHFDCCNYEYHYSGRPVKFYNKLVSLNRKRCKNKK